MRHFATMLLAGAVFTTAAPAFAQGWQGGYPYPNQSPYQAAPYQQPTGASEAEMRMRMALMQRSMGFGGIFAPMIKGLIQPSATDHRCDNYSDYGACQAAKVGEYWSADRLQNNQSSGSEKSWWGD